MTEAEKALEALNAHIKEWGYSNGLHQVVFDHFETIRKALQGVDELTHDNAAYRMMQKDYAANGKAAVAEITKLKAKSQGLLKALTEIACGNKVWEREEMIDYAVETITAFNSDDTGVGL